MESNQKNKETSNEVTIKSTVDDFYKDQHNANLMAYVGDKNVGFLRYSVYKNKPAIDMIYVNQPYRRQKIALKMLKKLQSMFPNTEIDWGYTTTDGTELKSSIKFRKEPNINVIKSMEKLDGIRSKLKQMNYKLEKLQNTNPEQARRYAQTVSDRWNKLNDLEYKLENQLSVMGKPYSQFIDDKLNEELNIIRKLAGIGNRKLNDIGSNISLTGNEKGELMKKHNIRPGTPEWMRLWFSLPYLTGEKPI